jgi:haloalkane dehalogenase
MRPDALRTPEERFANLPDFPYEPRYAEIDGYRVHYVDEGPRGGDAVFLVHGEPTWSYLYRKMIPAFTQAGYRVVAPDLVGFGRSDKPASRDAHSYQMHVNVMTELVRGLDLRGATLFGQDWGGLIGLRVLANEPDRFARAVAGNTGLPDAHPLFAPIAYALFKRQVRRLGGLSQEKLQAAPSFPRWVAFSQTVKEFPIGELIQRSTRADLPADVVAAYDAPFPDESYKEGPRAMPFLVPSQLGRNRRAWRRVLEKWEKPFLTAFSDGDPITAGGERPFQTRVPGARGQSHVTIEGAGHFLQEDKGEELARVILDFIERTKGSVPSA